MSKFARRTTEPEGYDYVEPTLTALENELREKVNESHEGLRKVESGWPVHQINWQKSRYIYDLYYLHKRISRQVYDYCIDNKLVDAGLIAKWKKPGYEKLCSTFAINPVNSKFGTVSICRVPRREFDDDKQIEDQTTGCRGCASGATTRNIFGNKYGQYLAAIQIAREEMQNGTADADDEDTTRKDKAEKKEGEGDDDEEENRKKLWASEEEADAAPSVVKDSAKSKSYAPPGKRARTKK